MSTAWQWDETLFRGSAAYYVRGRLPYPENLPEAFAGAANLSGSPRLLDVGCGPGSVTLLLAPLFHEAVGVDPDAAMLVEGERLAIERGIKNVRWVLLRAEHLPAGLGIFRYATFAQSFHWMQREVVARLIFDMLEPGGAFVHVNTAVELDNRRGTQLQHPPPPDDEIDALRQRYLGPIRRAGQGLLPAGTPGDEARVLEDAGFAAPTSIPVRDDRVFERSADDLVANVFAGSATAPHLFGDRLGAFESDLRRVLAAASPQGRFSVPAGDVELVFYRRP